MTKTKAALDNEGFGAFHPGYSMAILWSIPVDMLERDEARYGTETPLDGDAGPRAAFQALDVSTRWDLADAHLVLRLRNNHGEIGRNNR